MNKDICILLTSRNNYFILDNQWLPHIKKQNNIDEYLIINIDEDSLPGQKEYGKNVCEQNNIVYLDREKRGIHNNIITASNYIKDMGIKYIIWFQIDAWPVNFNFLNSFNNLVANGCLDDFGTVSFNGIDSARLGPEMCEILCKKVIEKGEWFLGVFSRQSLERGDAWGCGIKTKKCPNPVKHINEFRKPFSVSVPNWFGISVNIDKFKKLIDVGHPFHFFHSWDDICLQFCKNNIYNLVLPDYFVEHRQDLKKGSGVSRSSTRLAYKGDDTYHSLVGFSGEEFEKIWGYSWDKRETFEKIINKYKNTLLVKFYKHDIYTGPLKSFDICEQHV